MFDTANFRSTLPNIVYSNLGENRMGWTVGVDVGGTFTDFYAANDQAGVFHVHKTSSTPSNPAEAILNGLDVMCTKFDIPADEIERVSHGTTVGTNALIQRTGSRVALVTTKGFRDLLEVGRQTRPHMYDLQRDHPDPLVDREYRIELTERIGAKGEIVRAPSAEDIDAAVDEVPQCHARSCSQGGRSIGYRQRGYKHRKHDVRAAS